MKTTKSPIILLILALLTVGSARPAEDSTKAEAPATPPSKEISDTLAANCLVKITCDPGMLPLYIDTIDYLLRSSGVGGKAARDVLGTPLVEYLFEATELPLDVDSDSLGGVGLPPTRTRSSTYPGHSSEFYYFEDSGIQPGSTSERTAAPGTSTGKETSSDGHTTASPTPSSATVSRSSRAPTRSGGWAVAGVGQPPATASRYGRTTSTGGYSFYYGKPESTSAAPTRTTVPPRAPAAGQTFFFQLEVRLPDEVKPAAEEFMTALIVNLRETLVDAYNTYAGQLSESLAFAEDQRNRIEQTIAEMIPPIPADIALKNEEVRKQLDQIVDLSTLTPMMSFSEAIDVLENSVAPPLNIAVLWRDLDDNDGIADIEPTRPINMEGIRSISLGTALNLLLKSVSGGSVDLAYADLAYDIEGGVITVATLETIENIHNCQQQPRRRTQPDISPEELSANKQSLLREKRRYEMELARLEARRPAIGEQIARIRHDAEKKVHDDPVIHELERLLQLQKQHLETTKILAADGRISHIDLGDAQEKIARANIELAQRREQVVKSAGGDQIAQFNDELTKLTIDLAEIRAVLSAVNSQLEQTERQLKAATAFDPQASELRFAYQALDAANHRVNELKTRLANLQAPTVTALGAD